MDGPVLEMHGQGSDIVANKTAARQFLDATIDFTGGCAGGIASVYVGQPLDTIKVKMQTFPALYSNGAYHCFMTTLKQEGVVRGLYAGTVPSLAAQVSENAILFMAYGVCQKIVVALSNKSSVAELNVIQNALSGSMAAFFAALALCPTELIKCKLQAMKEMRAAGKLVDVSAASVHIGPWALTRQILREEGVRGMFRGLVPTFAREMPGYFFFFGGYEVCRSLLIPRGKTKDDLGPLSTMVCGGIGGMALWTAIFPADVVKSRIQIQTSQSAKNPSFFMMLFLIYRNEGVRALYKGLGPTLLRTFPATGALFLAYETTKKGLGNLADKAGVN